MTHEKIIKKENGDKVNIKVTFWMNHEQPKYDVFLTVCQKGKRLFKIVFSQDDYEYRVLSMGDRVGYKMKKYLEHVTEEQIYQAKIECWNKLKPANF